MFSLEYTKKFPRYKDIGSSLFRVAVRSLGEKNTLTGGPQKHLPGHRNIENATQDGSSRNLGFKA